MAQALIAARFLHIAALMALFGGSLFETVLAPVSLEGVFAPLRRLGPPLAATALVAALAWAALAARDMAGGELDAETLHAALTQTSFGRVWLGRLALIGLWLAALGLGARRVSLGLGGLVVASLALTGHAAAQEGALGAAHRLNQAVHLVAASAWVGGLAPFLACLRLYVGAPERRDALAAMRRYSTFGRVAVAAVLVSGALEIAMTLGALPWPATSAYRAALDFKIGCVLAMVAIALFNRYVTAPRLARRAGAAWALSAGSVMEITLGLAAIASVAAYGTWSPT